jgi:hypothetical protein
VVTGFNTNNTKVQVSVNTPKHSKRGTLIKFVHLISFSANYTIFPRNVRASIQQNLTDIPTCDVKNTGRCLKRFGTSEIHKFGTE